MLARFLTLLALVATPLLIPPGAAAATGVTASSYDASSTASDIRKSCKELRANIEGVAFDPLRHPITPDRRSSVDADWVVASFHAF